MYDLGSYPGVVRGQGTIWGEVYEISGDTLRKLDEVEGYRGREDDLYVRDSVTVYFDQRRKFKETGAQMYVYNQDINGRDPVPEGDYSARVGMPKLMNYFAYAENTDYEVLRSRGVRRILKEIKAYLDGYRVVFNVKCSYGLCANLEESKGSRVCGYIYLLTGDELNRLDRAEGHMLRYMREVYAVRDLESRTYYAVAYSSSEVNEEGSPSQDYLATIRRGLKRHWDPDQCL